MNKQERIAKIREKYRGTSTPPPAPAETQKEVKSNAVLNTLKEILSLNKSKKNDNVTPPAPLPPAKVEQAVTQEVSPKKENTFSERKQRYEERKQKRENMKLVKLYDEAVAKGLVKEGTVDSVKLKDTIKDNYDEVHRIVQQTPDPQIAKSRDSEAKNEALVKEYLQKHGGVKYVQPTIQQA
jgi:hypothetical protein